jgi:hypothetical protein
MRAINHHQHRRAPVVRRRAEFSAARTSARVIGLDASRNSRSDLPARSARPRGAGPESISDPGRCSGSAHPLEKTRKGVVTAANDITRAPPESLSPGIGRTECLSPDSTCPR